MKQQQLFLENTEGSLHANSKHKLFQLLIDSKIHLLDNNGFEYKIFPQINPTEFLHMEAFTVNYKNNAIYSDSNFSCIKDFNLEADSAMSNCDYQSNYGVCWELPCRECITDHYSLKNNDKNPIGYTPDIAYGYDNKYKIWIEICDKHPSTINKINFCMTNDIILLEVRAIDIEKLDSSFLMVMNLTSRKYWDAIENITGDDFESKKLKVFKERLISITEDINIKGYSLYSKHTNYISLYFLNYYVGGFKKFIEDRGFKVFPLNKIAKQKYNVSEENYPWIVVPLDTYNK